VCTVFVAVIRMISITIMVSIEIKDFIISVTLSFFES
jgi:hypothetical protein